MEAVGKEAEAQSEACVMCGRETTRHHPSETCSLRCQALRAKFDEAAGIERDW